MRLRPLPEHHGERALRLLWGDEPLRLECSRFLELVAGEGDRLRPAQDGLAVVRVLEQLQVSLVAAPA